MKQIIRRYLTNNPRLKAARALKELMITLPSITESELLLSGKIQNYKKIPPEAL